jgi:hypothetical protein
MVRSLSVTTPLAWRKGTPSQVIPCLRSPVSPSGIRRTSAPNVAATASNTAAVEANGTLPTSRTGRWPDTFIPRSAEGAERRACKIGNPRFGKT